jgi:hypothetical protein
MRRAFVRRLLGCRKDGACPDRHRAGAERTDTLWDDARVGGDDRHVCRIHAKCVCCDLGKARRRALACWAEARQHLHPSAAVYAHGTVFLSRSTTIEPARKSDPEQEAVARLSTAGLLGTQLLVADRVECGVECTGVVADVECEPTGAREGKLLGPGEVASSQLGRVHAQGGREIVHCPLHSERRLGAPGPPVRADRCGGGEHPSDSEVVCRPTVAACEHLVAVEEHHRHVAREVAAAVAGHACLHPKERSVSAGRDLDVLHLRSAMVGGLNVLTPRGRVPHRPAEMQRNSRAQHVFWIRFELGSKPAAHIFGNDPHVVSGETEHRGDPVTDSAGHLCGGVKGKGPAIPFRDGEGDARLEGCWHDSLMHVAALDDDIRLLERHSHIACCATLVFERNIRACLFVNECLATQRAVDVGDGSQGFVVHVNGF